MNKDFSVKKISFLFTVVSHYYGDRHWYATCWLFIGLYIPKGFVKIRYYGILANRNKAKNIALCRKLINSPEYPCKFNGLKLIEIVSLIAKKDVTLCPCCKKGKMKLIRTLHPCGIP